MNNLPVVRSPWRIVILLLGFTFLYAPMLMLVIYSFNSSKLVTVWAGWSTRWYGELLRDDAMMSAVGLSLTIAACAATAAAIPELLGGPDSIMIGRVLWQEFFNNRDWPVASAVAIIMLLLLIVPIMWFHKHQQKSVGEHG